jgi:NADH-quinone oxidoreductase subunit J
MAASSLYIASILSAIGLYLVLRPGARSWRLVGALLGLAGLSAITAGIVERFGLPEEGEPHAYYILFGLIAVIGAARMISHPKPVYAALYFILVVLSSAALFLLLQAEFMAFALVIVYAGAILITYMFVLMLAQQASENSEVEFIADYDRIPREPAGAVFTGFLMLALLGTALFGPKSQPVFVIPPESAMNAQWFALDGLPRKRDALIRSVEPRAAEIIEDAMGSALSIHDGVATADVRLDDGTLVEVVLDESRLPDNTDQVGQALVGRFPASLELAGIILLMAMFGAVVLARRQIELGEDERRAAAGMQPLFPSNDDGAKRATPARVGA